MASTLLFAASAAGTIVWCPSMSAMGEMPMPGGWRMPRCWCRLPLPGLLLEFTRRHRIDPARLLVVGTTAAHRKLAAAVGARFAL